MQMSCIDLHIPQGELATSFLSESWFPSNILLIHVCLGQLLIRRVKHEVEKIRFLWSVRSLFTCE